MKNKKKFILGMAILMLTVMTPFTVFAQSAEQEETIAVEESMEPLTPDGNLTLVDDAGDHPKGGKQFITLVSQNGNYFYLIIDRDKEGENTVHFLNQVDEADLLALMDEQEIESFKEQEDAVEVPTAEPVISIPEPEKKKTVNPLPAIMILLVMASGGGIYLYQKWRAQENQKKNKPDPDADYREDEEMIDLPEASDEDDFWEDEDMKSAEGFDA